MLDVRTLTIENTIRQLKSKEISAFELLRAFLENIEKHDHSVKAWAYLIDKDTLNKHVEDLIRENDLAEFPLFAIPYGAKDIIGVKDLPMEANSPIFKGNRSKKDATVIKKLNDAGALLLGKTTTAQLASVGGPPETVNPWNLQYSPGGSSSGSAAGVAAGMMLFSLGTQTSGSVIRPAAYNGITALKPTFGQISKTGILPSSWSIDTLGIFTKNVRDLIYVYNQVAGYDERDRYTYIYKDDHLSLSEADQNRKFTIAITEDPYFDASEEVMEAYWRSLKLLESAGHKIVKCEMPSSFAEASEAQDIVINTEAAAIHGSYFEEKKAMFCPELVEIIQKGLEYKAVHYLKAQDIRTKFKIQFKELFNDFDLLITPAITSTAPYGTSSTGSPKLNKPFTNAGLPSLALPNGFSSQNGLPIGLQVVANFNREQDLIDIGEQFQAMSDYHLQIPDILR